LAPEEDAAALFAIAARTPRLLVVALEVLGHACGERRRGRAMSCHRQALGRVGAIGCPAPMWRANQSP
jgi:hypothetical protein